MKNSEIQNLDYYKEFILSVIYDINRDEFSVEQWYYEEREHMGMYLWLGSKNFYNIRPSYHHDLTHEELMDEILKILERDFNEYYINYKRKETLSGDWLNDPNPQPLI
jgi:hypothetical protein